MKIRVFVSRMDLYHDIVIDTDVLELHTQFHGNDPLPTIFIDDLIIDLIDKN